MRIKHQFALFLRAAFTAKVAVEATAQFAASPLGRSNITGPNVGFNVLSLGQAINLYSIIPPYTVVEGDTLYGIAQLYGVQLACLEASNPQITDPDLIFPGQVINIPGNNDTFTYKVMSGDFLDSIAQQFHVSLGDLEDANPQIENPDLIFPDQIINIPNACSLDNSGTGLYQCGDAFYSLDAVGFTMAYCASFGSVFASIIQEATFPSDFRPQYLFCSSSTLAIMG